MVNKNCLVTVIIQCTVHAYQKLNALSYVVSNHYLYFKHDAVRHSNAQFFKCH